MHRTFGVCLSFHHPSRCGGSTHYIKLIYAGYTYIQTSHVSIEDVIVINDTANYFLSTIYGAIQTIQLQCDKIYNQIAMLLLNTIE